MSDGLDNGERPGRSMDLFGRKIMLPHSRGWRIAIGVLLIILGMVGFLPVVGFWMIPLGFLVLAQDLPLLRRWKRRLSLWWARCRNGSGGRLARSSNR